ncbi:hypothetical protein CMV_028035, partial [Castanea mollissima]
ELLARILFRGVRPTLVGGAFVSTPAALDSGTLTSEPVHVVHSSVQLRLTFGWAGSGTSGGDVGRPGHAVGS